MNRFVIVFFSLISLFLSNCASDGNSGEEGIDCGEHGSEHDGHCHCDEGYADVDDTCVPFDMVTDECENEASNEHAEDDTADTDDHAHADEDDAAGHEHYDACVCVDAADCHCDGDIETYGGIAYCVPHLH